MKEIHPHQVLKLLKNNSLFKYVNIVTQFLIENNFDFYFVGGTLRDAILSVWYKKKFCPQDIDIVVETKDYFGLFEKLKDLDFKNEVVEYKQHPQFLTFSILLESKNLRIDLSVPRKERYEFSGALPKVDYGNIEEDLFRRDFTINAISLKYNKTNNNYYFFDPQNGLWDLFYKKIRILHNKSFIDDPTRILRAIRFAASLNFKIEKNTEKLLIKAINSDVLYNISKVRLYNEFLYILKKGKNLELVSKYFLKYNILKYYKEIKKILDSFIKKSKKIELKKINDVNVRFYLRLFYLIENSIGKIKPFNKENLNNIRDIMIKLYLNKQDKENIYKAVKIFSGIEKTKNKFLPLWIKYYCKIFNKEIPSLTIKHNKIIALGIESKYINRILSYIAKYKVKNITKTKLLKILNFIKNP